jgi:hypothetical protein
MQRMKKILVTLGAWLAMTCAVWAQGVPGIGGPMIPGSVPFVGFSLLSKSGTSASHTGDTNETVLATITIPPSTIGANGQIKLNVFWNITNSANSKTIKARLGGIGGTALFTGVMTTIANVWSTSILISQNATNSQNTFTLVSRGTDGLITTGAVTSSLDMTQSQSLVLTGQLANTGETITVLGYTVEVAS